MLRKELSIFLTAVMFYTRIPCPKWIDHSPDLLNKSTRYFPFIGWVVGTISGVTFYMASMIFPSSIAVVMSTIAGILTTGAFHEDGFADVCDGFGGGWTKTKILKIMKDSAIGAYGAIGMMLMLSLKCLALFSLTALLDTFEMVLIIVSGHSLSRTNAMLLIFTDQYARSNEDSKAKPVAKKLSNSSLAFGIIIGVLPLFSVQEPLFFTAIPLLYLFKWRLSLYFNKWIDGYTGDCLGAVQQISELIFYLFILSAWKYI